MKHDHNYTPLSPKSACGGSEYEENRWINSEMGGWREKDSNEGGGTTTPNPKIMACCVKWKWKQMTMIYKPHKLIFYPQ